MAQSLEDIGAVVTVVPVGADAAALVKAASSLARLLRADRPDVVLGNGVKAQAAVIAPAKAMGIPTVWVKHDHSFDTSLARPLGSISTAVVATAAEVGQAASRSDLVVIEPERPPAPLERERALERLGEFGYRPDGRPAVVMIGRLVPYKGVDVAIRALAYPEAGRASDAACWRLVVIGGDDPATPQETGRLRQLAADLGVADRVHFCGPIPQAGQVVSGFEALAVLTRPGQPGAPQREGYGITATEAMLAGVPVVVAGEGPIARRIATPDGPAGVVVGPGDPLSTARGLALLAHPEVRATYGRRGQAVARSLPDADEVAAAVLRVLQEATR
jgi:glycosyltransferase involved in cell wall biosynthesis